MEEIDLKELFIAFWNKKLVIILITLISVLLGVVYSYFFVKPVYEASTTLVLAQNSTSMQNGQSGISQTDVNLNAKLVDTYREIMKNTSILRQVVENLNNPKIKEETIEKNIVVASVKETDLIEITITNPDPNIASAISNEIAKVFSEKIVEIYNISNVYLLSPAEPNNIPSNIHHAKDIVIFAFLGIVLSGIYVFLVFMFDTTIKSEEDIEKLTGLIVLSSIPDYEVENDKRKGKGGKRA